MMYSIIFSDLSLKQLRKLDKLAQSRIIATINRCRVRPYSHVKKLVDSPYYRLRVGKYRVIINIMNHELRIFVIEVKHRKDVYN